MGDTATGAPTQAPHGVKRRAEDDPRDEQRLTKRFDLLNLDHNGKLYVPVPDGTSSTHGANGDSMHLDDTKDKVYIHNLDEELASIDAEENMVFLPDIEKKIGKIPHHILTGDLQPTAENQMVLYSVPSSLTVPEEQDNVRKAIIESRARAREMQLGTAAVSTATMPTSQSDSSKFDGLEYDNYMQDANAGHDEDAMDLG